ncbi:MAG: hypothetical protein WKF77_01995 [Planctomycetaceae bacterium]
MNFLGDKSEERKRKGGKGKGTQLIEERKGDAKKGKGTQLIERKERGGKKGGERKGRKKGDAAH